MNINYSNYKYQYIRKYIFLLQVIISEVMIITQIIGANFLYSIGLKIIIVLSIILLYFSIFRNNFKWKDIITFFCICLFLWISFIAVSKDGLYEFEYLNRWIIFICIILNSYNFDNISLNNSMIKFLFRVNYMVGSTFILYSLKESNFIQNILIYNFPNQNGAGFHILIVSIYMILSLKFIQNKIEKNYIRILILINIYLIWLTGSRTAFICILLYIILLNIKYKKNYIVNLIICTFPLIISSIYVTLWNNIYDKKIMLFGKPFFSEREGIWIKVFEIYRENIWFNMYSEPNNVGFTQFGAHNIYIGILWEYGVIILILTILINYVFIKRIEKNDLIIKTILIIMISQSFEDIIYKNIIFGILFFALPVIVNKENINYEM